MDMAILQIESLGLAIWLMEQTLKMQEVSKADQNIFKDAIKELKTLLRMIQKVAKDKKKLALTPVIDKKEGRKKCKRKKAS